MSPAISSARCTISRGGSSVLTSNARAAASAYEPPDPIARMPSSGSISSPVPEMMMPHTRLFRAVEIVAAVTVLPTSRIVFPVMLEMPDAVTSMPTVWVLKDASGVLPDGTKVNGVVDLRKSLARYSTQFVQVVAEKMLMYATGRGTEHEDMPMVRAIVRDAAANNYKFSSLVLSIVKSDVFRMNQKGAPAPPAAKVVAAGL